MIRTRRRAGASAKIRPLAAKRKVNCHRNPDVAAAVPQATRWPRGFGPVLPGDSAHAGEAHSSGTPALRRPAKYVASTKARILGTPQESTARKRAMLE